MPINCPIPFGENKICRECYNFWDNNCNYLLLSPMPIRDILDCKEYAEHILQPAQQQTNTTNANLYKQMEHLRAMVLDLQNKLNAHLDYKKKPAKPYKGITNEAEHRN